MSVQSTVGIELLHAPFDDTTSRFLDFIAEAKRSIHMCIYGYHLPKLGDLLIAAHQTGLEVSVILDHSQEQGKAEHGEVQRLIDAGVPIAIGTSPVHRQILHDKCTVVDGGRVELGSWNYSTSAGDQLNNMVFLTDERVAAACLRVHNQILGWIKLHEMVYQEQGETFAAPVADVVSVATPALVTQLAPAGIASSGALGSATVLPTITLPHPTTPLVTALRQIGKRTPPPARRTGKADPTAK